MSASLTSAALAVATVLSPELKAQILAAAETHLSTVTAQVNQVKTAIQNDLPGVASTVTNVEALVKAEVAKLQTDFSTFPNWIKGVMAFTVVAVAVGSGIVVDHVVHLF